MSFAPLLSKLLPVPLALKGLSKINSKIGKFIVDATAYGYGGDQILEYLRNQFDSSTGAQKEERTRLESNNPALRPDESASLQQMKQREAFPNALNKGFGIGARLIGGLGGLQEGEETNEQPTQRTGTAPAVTSIQEEQIEPPESKSAIPQGILEALSPKLKQFVEDRLSKGHPLTKIAALAKSHFFDEINQIQQESGMDFGALLESLYGKQRESSRVMGLQQQEPNQGKQQLANSMMAAVEMMRQIRGK